MGIERSSLLKQWVIDRISQLNRIIPHRSSIEIESQLDESVAPIGFSSWAVPTLQNYCIEKLKMSYFEFRKDMSEYDEVQPEHQISILNVGWIGQGIAYPTGKTPSDFIEKVERLIINSETSSFKPIVWRCRGQDSCPICDLKDLALEKGTNTEVLGSSELLIPSNLQYNLYFISPSLIHHFVSKHNYLPPVQFIDSILAIDENSKFEGERIYMSSQGLEDFLEID